jgi:hypothetical protein
MVGKTRNGLVVLASFREKKKLAPSNPLFAKVSHTEDAIVDLPVPASPWSTNIHGELESVFSIQRLISLKRSTRVFSKHPD